MIFFIMDLTLGKLQYKKQKINTLNPLKVLWYNLNMDFIIGFLIGYFLKEISKYLKRITQWDLDNRIYNKDWDSWEYTNPEDLP